MRVLEAPQTWIAAAAVLVLIAVVLIALAPRRRRRAPEAGPAPVAAAPVQDVEDPDTDPFSLRGAGARDEDAVTAPATPSGPAPVTGVAPSPVPRDGSVQPLGTGDPGDTDDTGRADDTAEPADPGRRYVPAASEERSAEAPTDPARTSDRAKDRLLAALLPDHRGAVDVLAAMPEDGPASGADAAALLRTGLSPTQVASLCGVDPSDLADRVASELGLLESARTTGGSPSQDSGDSRTEVPGRAWASAGSAAGSTTPTTG